MSTLPTQQQLAKLPKKRHAKKNHLFPHESIPCTTTLYNYIDCCLI